MMREVSASERPSHLPRPSLKLCSYLREINYRRGERNPELGLRLARRRKVVGRLTRQKPTHLPSANVYSILPPRIPITPATASQGLCWIGHFFARKGKGQSRLRKNSD